MNKILQPFTKIVRYSPAITHYAIEETSSEFSEPITGVFELVNIKKAKIIYQENATVVIFQDGSKGIAKCGEKDSFSRKKGLNLAFYRALIEHLKKEIERICNERN